MKKHCLEQKVPPVVVLAVVVALMWMGSRIAPAAAFQMPARVATSLVFAVVGVGIAVAGVVSFWHAKTTIKLVCYYQAEKPPSPSKAVGAVDATQNIY